MPKTYAHRERIVATDGEQSYNYSKKVKIQSQYPAHLKYRGRASGELYEWLTPGTIVEVLEEDAPALLEMVFGSHSCCGQSSVGNKPFRLVER